MTLYLGTSNIYELTNLLVDNKTIDLNTQKQLEAIGVWDKHSNTPLKIWVGDYSEYVNLTIDPETLYFVSGDDQE